MLTVVAGLGGAKELGLVLDGVLGGNEPAARRAGLLSTLARATRERGVRPAGDLSRVTALLDKGDEPLRAAAARAAGAWGVEPALSASIEPWIILGDRRGATEQRHIG